MIDFTQILTIIGSALFMIFFFGMCIFIHELGHFLAAKWRGLHVIAFSIGFRKIWGYRWKGVEYRIGWIPFGGYVEIPQIDAVEEAKDENGNVLPKGKPVDRMIAAAAGPVFNIIFGFLLACVIWVCGIQQDSPELNTIEVASIEAGSPEYKAGLREGDRITHINGKKINMTWNSFITEILITIGDVKLTVVRNGKTFPVSYKPAINKNVNPADEVAYPFFKPKLPLKLYPEKGSPAELAGILAGDELISVNGEKISDMIDLERFLLMNNAKKIDMRVKRGNQIVEIRGILPRTFEEGGKKGIWMIGITYNPSAKMLKVMNIAKGLPAEKAGLLKDDEIYEINSQKLKVPTDLQRIVNGCDGKTLKLGVLRNGKKLTISMTPELIRFSTIGVEYAYIAHPSPWKQFTHVINMTVKSLRSLGVSIGNKLGLTKSHTTIQPRHLSGPIGIGRVLYLSVYRGSLIYGLNLVVIITFSLGLFNLFPIPVLDGGHILLAFLELIFRKPVSPAILKPITTVFIALLISFMLFVSFYDVRRIIYSFVPAEPDARTQKSEVKSTGAKPENVTPAPDKKN